MDVGDAVVKADPFVAMVVSSHAVIQHISSLLDQLRQVAAGRTVLGVLAHVIHHQYYLLTHNCALNGCAPAVHQVALVFLDSLLDAVLEYLLRGGILETEGTLDHLV
jgi:hypothetical protein